MVRTGLRGQNFQYGFISEGFCDASLISTREWVGTLNVFNNCAFVVFTNKMVEYFRWWCLDIRGGCSGEGLEIVRSLWIYVKVWIKELRLFC